MDTETSGYNGARPQEGKAIANELPGNTGQVGGTNQVRSEGLWRHPNAKNPDGSPVELVTTNDPLLGDGQGRAAERAGFEYVGPAPAGYVKELGAPSEHYASQPERANESQAAELADLRARLAALEASQSAPAGVPVVGDAETKEAAAQKNEEHQALNDQDYASLQAELKARGLNAKGSKEELTQRLADAKAEENK